MTLYEILEEAQNLKAQLSLTLNSPTAVKLQIKKINMVQKQLRVLKKELNATIRIINQDATQTGADSLISVGLDVFGKHKWAGRVRAETRRAIDREKRSARQPYMEARELIDAIILEGEQLKLRAEEFLLRN